MLPKGFEKLTRDPNPKFTHFKWAKGPTHPQTALKDLNHWDLRTRKIAEESYIYWYKLSWGERFIVDHCGDLEAAKDGSMKDCWRWHKNRLEEGTRVPFYDVYYNGILVKHEVDVVSYETIAYELLKKNKELQKEVGFEKESDLTPQMLHPIIERMSSKVIYYACSWLVQDKKNLEFWGATPHNYRVYK